MKTGLQINRNTVRKHNYVNALRKFDAVETDDDRKFRAGSGNTAVLINQHKNGRPNVWTHLAALVYSASTKH